MRTEDAKKVSMKVTDAVIGVKAMHPKYSAAQILGDIKNNRVIYRLNNERLPSRAEVYKILRENKEEVKNREKKLSAVSTDLDKDWTIGCMVDLDPKYHISPESILHISLLQDYANDYLQPPFNLPYPHLTIRQALWASRLYPIISRQHDNKYVNKDNLPQLYNKLWKWSEAYATYERINKAFNPPLDTAEMDQALREGATPVVAYVGEEAETPSVIIFHPDDRVSMVPPKKEKG